MFELDWKLVMGLSSAATGVASTIPYIRDILAKKTEPHLYSWLVWTITLSVASYATITGGGGPVALGLAAWAFMVFSVFILSFFYGTKNVTRSDTIALTAALIAVVVWVQLDNPLLALLIVTAIDTIAYIPTYRKTFEEPWSETLSFWILSATSIVIALLAIAEYNFMTTFYLIAILLVNVGMVTLLWWRRKFVPVPQITQGSVAQ